MMPWVNWSADTCLQNEAQDQRLGAGGQGSGMSGFLFEIFAGTAGVHIQIAQQTQTNQTIDTDTYVSTVRTRSMRQFDIKKRSGLS